MNEFPENWRNKTPERLEGTDLLSNPEFESYMISRIIGLRKTPLCDFSVEDLRLFIEQQIGLPFVTELAIEILEKILFVEGDYQEGDYQEGDLLESLLRLPISYWKSNSRQWKKLNALIVERAAELHEMKISSDQFKKAYY
ncbi:hypothetical protein BH11BAC2_BH11BAC2_19000 [soil metagenome]